MGRRSGAAALLPLMILLGSLEGCAAPRAMTAPKEERRARVGLLLDVAESITARSSLELVDGGSGASLGGGSFESAIEGRAGLGLLMEVPLGPAWSLRTGVLAKRFRPHDIPGLGFEEAEQLEGLVAARVRARPRGGPRPWAELRVGWVPETRIQSTFDPGGALSTELDLRGDAYAKAGVAAGLEWPLQNRWRLEVGSGYDIPLGSADAETQLALAGLPPVVTRTTIEPRGWTFWIGLTWSP
jgi:hypothetical protein